MCLLSRHGNESKMQDIFESLHFEFTKDARIWENYTRKSLATCQQDVFATGL